MQPEIKVGIMAGTEIEFTLQGLFLHVQSRQKVEGRGMVRFNDNEITVTVGGKTLPSDQAIEFNPVKRQIARFTLHGVTIGRDFHWQRQEDQEFKGCLRLELHDNELNALNIVPIEDYLCSVISSEMSAKASLELLKAHAVISRSWLLAQLAKSKQNKIDKSSSPGIENEELILKWYDREDHPFFDVCADDHCQRYQGTTRETTSKARDAVMATEGIVLTHDNQICDTRYSKCCGGVTELFSNTWEPIPRAYLTKLIDWDSLPENFNLDLTSEENAERWINSSPPAYCNTYDKEILAQVLNNYDQETAGFFRWKLTYSQEQLKAILKTKANLDIGDIIDMQAIERGESARIIKLLLTGTKGRKIIGKELEIRRSLSETHLYSSAFVITKEPITEGIPRFFTLTGAGWGHGVGLCQIGAAVMGARGYDYKQILSHYFKGTRFAKNWADFSRDKS